MTTNGEMFDKRLMGIMTEICWVMENHQVTTEEAVLIYQALGEVIEIAKREINPYDAIAEAERIFKETKE